VLHRIENRGAIDTAHRARGYCDEVYCFAMASGMTKRNPAVALGRALKTVKGEHFAAITDPKQLGAMLRAFDTYQGTAIVSTALKVMPLVFVRPFDLRTARWEEIDLDAAEWRFTISKTKTPIIVPLAK
jgi:integrase